MTISPRPPIDCLLVDLDDCLYECVELRDSVAKNIRIYMRDKLGVSEDEVEEKCRELYLNWGTTLAGLVAAGYTVDFADWHACVHGSLPYDDLLKPDPKLKTVLNSIPIQKYIFTNADLAHAERCLALLGLRDCFQGVICFENIMAAARDAGIVHHNRPVVCKPQRQAFALALQQAGGAEAATTAFFDDSTRNVTTSHHLGIFTVLVGRTGVDCATDEQILSMHELPTHLPWLFAVGDGRPPALDAALVVGNPKAEELAEEAPRQQQPVYVQA